MDFDRFFKSFIQSSPPIDKATEAERRALNKFRLLTTIANHHRTCSDDFDPTRPESSADFRVHIRDVCFYVQCLKSSDISFVSISVATALVAELDVSEMSFRWIHHSPQLEEYIEAAYNELFQRVVMKDFDRKRSVDELNGLILARKTLPLKRFGL